MATYYTIAQVLDDINGEVIGTGGFSDFSYLVINTGDKGSEFKEKINTNFYNNAGDHQAFYDTFQVVVSALNKRIISEDVPQIRIGSNNNLEYSTDGENWIPVVTPHWGDIVGDSVLSQTDLAAILNAKAPLSEFNTLSNRFNATDTIVTNHTSQISNHETRIGDLEEETSDQGDDIQQLQNDIRYRVNGNGIKQIKEQAGKVYFSLQEPTDPNPIWTPITVGTSAQVSWGNVAGTITNQLDLIEYIANNYATGSSLSAHVGDTNNPHSVTKAQIGLGNVDNTSDANKPISSAVSLALGDKVDKSTYNQDIPDIQDVLDSLPSTYVSAAALNAHTSDTSNPHQVTATQLGLDQVDNTADVDKPVSNAVYSLVANMMTSRTIVSVEEMDLADYITALDNLTIDEDYIYFIND